MEEREEGMARWLKPWGASSAYASFKGVECLTANGAPLTVKHSTFPPPFLTFLPSPFLPIPLSPKSFL